MRAVRWLTIGAVFALGTASACADASSLRERQAQELRRLCSAFLTDPDLPPEDRPTPQLSVHEFRMDQTRDEPFSAISVVAERCL